ncbi:AraC family transcriptional regulator [Massilia arenae]|uniref:AraC family transcriptional regulator n=1 Tax=Massilia arenae TaxID=2603288 RepID=A0A5C7G035_9BURK|nr:AraC family transcriptional regulator [Massilia arenae]TXF96759.1 AraC family transcriptional regulator [Massilia arenae]
MNDRFVYNRTGKPSQSSAGTCHLYDKAHRSRCHGCRCQPHCHVTVVAALVGYADQGYFTRRFRLAVGVTPARYARQGGAGRTHAILTPFRLSLRI